MPEITPNRLCEVADLVYAAIERSGPGVIPLDNQTDPEMKRDIMEAVDFLTRLGFITSTPTNG